MERNTRIPDSSPEGHVRRSPSPRSAPPRRAASPLFGIFLILWILFAVALMFDQGALDSVWHWLTGLPVILQVIVWILFLPVTLGLWIWESAWPLWLRLILVILIGLGNIGAFSPRPRNEREGKASPQHLDLGKPAL